MATRLPSLSTSELPSSLPVLSICLTSMAYDAYGYPLHSGHSWESHTPQWTLSNTSTPDSILAPSPLPGTNAADDAIMKRAMYPYQHQTLHGSHFVPNVVSPLSVYSPDLHSPLALASNPYIQSPTPIVHFAAQTPFSPSVPVPTLQPTHENYTGSPLPDNSLGLHVNALLDAAALPAVPVPAPAPTPPSVVTPATPATHVTRRSKQRKTFITEAEVDVYKKIRRAAYGTKVFCAVPRCFKAVAKNQYVRHLKTHARSFVRCQHCEALLSRDDARVRHEKVNCKAKEKSRRGSKNLKKGAVPDCN